MWMFWYQLGSEGLWILYDIRTRLTWGRPTWPSSRSPTPPSPAWVWCTSVSPSSSRLDWTTDEFNLLEYHLQTKYQIIKTTGRTAGVCRQLPIFLVDSVCLSVLWVFAAGRSVGPKVDSEHRLAGSGAAGWLVPTACWPDCLGINRPVLLPPHTLPTSLPIFLTAQSLSLLPLVCWETSLWRAWRDCLRVKCKIKLQIILWERESSRRASGHSVRTQTPALYPSATPDLYQANPLSWSTRWGDHQSPSYPVITQLSHSSAPSDPELDQRYKSILTTVCLCGRKASLGILCRRWLYTQSSLAVPVHLLIVRLHHK